MRGYLWEVNRRRRCSRFNAFYTNLSAYAVAGILTSINGDTIV